MDVQGISEDSVKENLLSGASRVTVYGLSRHL